MIWIVLAILVITAGSYIGVMASRMNQIPTMTFEEMLAYTTKDNENAVVTVGIIQNGVATYTTYGENGVVLPNREYAYEIGSVTKTFTAALVMRAVEDGLIDLDDSIDRYLVLPKRTYYPTIRRLITHTSGYKGAYFEWPMIANKLKGRNDFYGVSTEMLIERVGRIALEDRDYDFRYSNFGLSVVGAVLEQVYGTDYRSLVDSFIQEELQLGHTRISDGNGDLGKLWAWQENDAYLAAGALLSTIGDMLQYAQFQLDQSPPYLSATHESLATIHATSASYAAMGIRMDEAGAAWMIDTQHNIIWHNGGTGDYNSYIGFDLERQIAVVVLCNLPPNYRIPATMMGVRLMQNIQTKTN